MRKSLWSMAVLAVAVSVAPACATKKFVRTEVGNVNAKVDTLGKSLEETQERTRRNEERIGAVDQKAEAAGRSAQDARGAADAAAGAAQKVNGRVDQVVTEVAATNAAVAAVRKLLFEVTLNEQQGNFAAGKAGLPDTAKARLDEVVGQLKSDPRNIFIEIEGHTDNTGAADLNQKLGLERAEAVKRYLYEQHQVPLHKMNVISYGEDKPVAPNNNRDGRAQNRRVVVKVLS
jgi:peptidoglycan-associated lipoprotein